MNFVSDKTPVSISGRHSSGEENIQLDFTKGEFFLFCPLDVKGEIFQDFFFHISFL